MQEQDWGDEELWIVTASDRQEAQPTGQKSPTRDFNPYNGCDLNLIPSRRNGKPVLIELIPELSPTSGG